jgi:AcrR family transcriptional regulator
MSNNNNGNQERVRHLWAEGASTRSIAKQLGISRSSVRSHQAALALKGFAPGALVTAAEVPGMSLSKTTVQYDAAGNLIQEWRRLRPDVQDAESWVATLEERVRGKAPKIKRLSVDDADLLLELPVPDHHMGMLAWGQETGEDYDCKIATKLLVGGVQSVLAELPPVRKIALVVLGDYYHSDDRSGMTEKSGNRLDTDSRFARRVDAGIEAMCGAVELCAGRAYEVEVIVLSGNHDWHSAKWLARVLAAYYKDLPQVTIRTDPAPQQFVRHGNVLLAYTHGDTMKAQEFARLIPALNPKDWAGASFRYGRIGHWHRRVTEEFPGVVVETLPTLAAPDAYAADHGFRSARAITACLWSAKWGLRAKLERSHGEILEVCRG